MRISFYTLGCKVNQFETHLLSDRFAAKGFKVVEFGKECEVCIVNTCCVTARAAYQARQMLRRIKREQPETRIVVTGCYAQVYPHEIFDALDGQACIVGNDQKQRLPEIAGSSEDCLRICVGDITRIKSIEPYLLSRPYKRTRAFMKIQDGCNSFCSYCIVPYARGRSRSLPLELVKKQASIFAEHGIKEIVLTGINLAQWGRDLSPPSSFLDLLKELLPAFPGVRFRISSFEPTEITGGLLKFLSDAPNFCHHFHIPLQSGSSKVLKKMNRNYTPDHFAAVLDEVRSCFPDAAIGIDVMAGFPGETRQEFEKGLSFIKTLPFTYIHAFPYSSRPGTLASGWKEECSKKEKQDRVRELISMGRTRKRRFLQGAIGKKAEVLIEQRDKKSGLWKGLSSNYIGVMLGKEYKDREMGNKLVRVILMESEQPDFLYGKVVEDEVNN